MTEMSFPNQSTPSPNQPPVPPAGKPPRTTRKIVFSVLGVLVALVVIFAGLVTCRMVTHTAVPSATTDPTPYTRLTKEMTDALAAKDEAAFLKPFKGDELREKQSKVFRNLVRIPWQEARWEQQLVVPQNGSLQVNFVHQVRGVDAKPVAEEYNWRIGHENGVPVITEVGSASDSSAYYPAPWDLYDDLAVENRDHLVVVADKGQSAELERDADVLAQAAKDDLDAWHRVAPSVPSGRQPGPGFFVVLEKNRDVYNKLYAGDGRANDQLEAGVNIGMPADGSTSAHEFGGSRIVIDTSLSAFTSANWQEDVSEIGRHEMAHAILAPLETEQVLVAGMQKTQTWVVEGFAEYMAFRGKDNLAQANLKAALHAYQYQIQIPGSHDFYSSRAQNRSVNYALAGSAIGYLARKNGEDKLFAFVVAHYSDPGQYDQEIMSATGRTKEQFQADWVSYVGSIVPEVR
ncbi:hypothetical protein [Kitasatospora sp. NPDC058190]|uniref:hypothetical protein n=1 Tax=Kitasatospora sp. NPDC058190 TaxID=3346371 RepID=UPI0036DD7870